MSLLPAARSALDFTLCPSHGPGLILPMPTAKLVIINKLFAAKAKDMVLCMGGPLDYIVTGAKDVLINGQPGARLTSKTIHKSIVMGLSTNVFYGGPSVGVTMGNPDEAEKMCQKSQRPDWKDRKSLSPLQQGYDQNCGCESARMLLNHANGTSVSEKEYLECQEKNGNASKEWLQWQKDNPGGPTKKNPEPASRGNSDSEQRDRQLENKPPCVPGGGLPSRQIPQCVEGENGKREISPEMQSAVANGQGVVANTTINTVKPGALPPGGGNHSVIVSGVTYDSDGNVESITVVDTGYGDCKKVIGADRFAQSIGKPGDPNANANATDKPIFSPPKPAP